MAREEEEAKQKHRGIQNRQYLDWVRISIVALLCCIVLSICIGLVLLNKRQ